jgi:hypothetical protein
MRLLASILRTVLYATLAVAWCACVLALKALLWIHHKRQ